MSEGTISCLKQSWGCSQAEDDREEEDTTDWLEDDEMMRQWEEVSKDEGKITLKQDEIRNIKCEGVQKVPELMLSQVQMRKRE